VAGCVSKEQQGSFWFALITEKLTLDEFKARTAPEHDKESYDIKGF